MEEIKTALIDLLTSPSEEFIVQKFSGEYNYQLKPGQGFVGVHSEEICRVTTVRFKDKNPKVSEFVIQRGRDIYQVNPPIGNSIDFFTVEEVIDFVKEYKAD